jgi:regulator of replication initiation timing
MLNESQPESHCEEQLPTLEDLREQVQAAAQEIHRLRRENEQLRNRVRTLKERPQVEPDQTFVVLDEKPAKLRRKVDGFIDAIDHYLDEDGSS